MATTPYYRGLIDPRDPACPIALQALPSELERDPRLPDWARELSRRAFGRDEPWLDDPIGDLTRLAAPRLTHRYESRALLHVASRCAVDCRFCFRKEHLAHGEGAGEGRDQEPALYAGEFDAAFAYLRGQAGVRELILTGGDPLTLPDAALERLLDRVELELPHVQTVRLHSRSPVTLPSRLGAGLAAALGRARPFTVTLMTHFNHPRELTPDARAGLDRLRRAGVPLYNQAVLLRKVNDSAETLARLFEGLYAWGVTPVYLHHPDWTPRTFGFRRSIPAGRAIARELQGRVAGPALPRYVLDLPGGHGKVDLLDVGQTRILETREGDGLEGYLHELTPPRTRGAPKAGGVLYLDLSPG